MAPRKAHHLGTVITCALIAMFFVVMLQIFARYVIRASIPWTEELSRYLLVFMTFFGAAVALKENRHITISILIDFLPDKYRVYVDVFFKVIILLFLAAVLRGSIKMVLLTWETPAGTIPWITTGRIYLILPVSVGLMVIYLGQQLVDVWKRLYRQDNE